MQRCSFASQLSSNLGLSAALLVILCAALLAPAPLSARGFQTGPPQLQVGLGPVFVVAADLRGIKRQDLIVANPDVSSGGGQPGNTISVLLSNGDGTYQPAVTYTVGLAPIGIAVADFNGDGHPDLAVANAGDNTVSILLGDGKGNFNPKQTLTAGANPAGPFAADLEGDGKVDLVVTNSDLFANPPDNCANSSISIFHGNGDGTFSLSSTLPLSQAGQCPLDAALVDLNGDKKLDLVVVDHGPDSSTTNGNVNVLLGNGDGTFQPAASFTVGSRPQFVAVADFNNDGKMDLAVSNEGSKGTGANAGVTILPGNGNGTFQPATFISNLRSGGVVAGKFTGSGNFDLATVNDGGGAGSVSVVLGNGNGTFEAPKTFALPNVNFGFAAADLNGDGKLDLAAPIDNSPNPGAVALLFGNGDGTLRGGIATYSLCPNCSLRALATADFNNDGKIDLAVAGTQFGTTPAAIWGVLFGNGDGTFSVSPGSALAGNNGLGVAVGRFADNFFGTDLGPDIVVSENANTGTGDFTYIAGDGTGAFSPKPATALAFNPFQATAADFNADGSIDLALGACNGVEVSLGNGAGVFGSFSLLNAGSFCVSGQVAAGQLFGSPRQDIVVADVDSATNNLNAYVFQSLAAGGFSSATATKVGSITGYTGVPLGVALGHFNEATPSGHLDAVVANPAANTVTVLLNNGSGALTAGTTYNVSPTPVNIAVGDFDGDGHLDLAIADCGACFGNTGANAAVSVLYGNGDGTFTSTQKPIQTYFAGAGSNSLAVGDFNRDGAPDLAVANMADGTVSILLNTGATVVSVSSSASPALVGTNVTFTAAITPTVNSAPVTGTVQFMDNGTQLGSPVNVANGLAMFSTSTLANGAHPITAVYSGDTNYNPNTSPVFTQTMTFPPTTTTLVTDNNSPFLGQPFTLTATVTGCAGTLPAGSVTFNSDGSPFHPVALANGQAGISLAFANPAKVGNNPTFAVYNPSNNCGASTSGTIDVVGRSDITTTTVSSGANPSNAGTAVTFTATVSSNFGPPAGSVTFTAAGQTTPPPVPLPATGNQSISVTQNFTFNTSGGFDVQASYTPADRTWAASASSALIQNVNCTGCVNTTTAIAPLRLAPLDPAEKAGTIEARQKVTIIVTVTPASGAPPTGSVQLMDNGANFGGPLALTASGGQSTASITLTGLPRGFNSFTAMFPGDGTTFNPSDSSAAPVVVKVTPQPHGGH